MSIANVGLSVIATGTVTATNGSAVVAGQSIGSAWQATISGQTIGAVGNGDWLIIGSFAPEMILSCDTGSQITLQRAWPNATQTTQPYKIIRVTSAEAIPSSIMGFIAQLLNLGLQANPFLSALVASGSRMLQIVASGTDMLIKIGAQSVSPAPSNSDMAALVTAIKIDSTGKVTFPLGAPEMPRRNLLYNGALQIAQRGVTGFTASGYTFDRWYMGVTGTITLDSTGTVPTSAPIFQRSVRFTSGAAASNATFWQALEANDLHAFKGKRVTFSCYTRMQTAFSGNVKLTVETGDTANVVSSGVWTPLTAVAGLGTNTAGLIAPTTSFQLVSITVDIPTTLTGLRFGITTDTGQASGNIWYVCGIRAEFGSAVGEWQPEDAVTELFRCQRYFQKSYAQSVNPASVTTTGQVAGRAAAAAANQVVGMVRCSPTMRATPTLTIYNPSDGNTTAGTCVRNVTGAASVNGTVETGLSENGFTVRTTSTPAAGDSLTFQYTLAAELP